MRQWDEHKRANPDWIGNNPGVTRCSGKLIRTLKNSNTPAKTKVFNCQLRYDHTNDCISYSGHKTWMKGIKRIEWEQLALDNLLTTSPTEPVLSEHVRNLLSRLDPDTNP